MSIKSLFIAILVSIAMLLVHGCAFRGVKRAKGITYLEAGQGNGPQQLNIFAPRNKQHPHPVFIYLYGGNWTSGKRSLYSFLGNRLARKGIVAVIVDYPKSPDAQYDEMAADAAKATKWIQAHIAAYSGDPAQLFVAGHSAGGHLAALISTDDHYFKVLGIANPIKGTILIDAAGLDMYGYMKNEDYGPNNSYLNIFTKDPDTWKRASPLYHLDGHIPSMFILRGGRTYPSIMSGNDKFVAALRAKGYAPVYTLQPGKRHIPMITQFFNVYNPRYRDMLRFMRTAGE
jgi:acetyl esterase/lipase